ncbi:MAG: YqeG family HAD IIIA-type phosphatase [Cytophagales bacterium]|nr:YqeG family HAD IIIA-type phosphatase [Armatimonadota bacterium]
MKTRKQLLTPDRLVRHVSDISPALLAEQFGVRAVICDLDNTLAEWHSEKIATEVAGWIAALKKTGIGVCIASNTRNLRRLERVAGAMEVLHVPGNAGKPGVSGLKHALSLLDAHPGEAAMVGDQLFTDIVAGNRLGLYTVLVNPLAPHEFFATKFISRNLERLILRGERARLR